ncbi:DUF5678 domain-containing protein [Paraburkholderia kururiensis]|uniref:hypothetical protein n=1 Tax=Paraburkholderia kururiensis TaxID=984307 RepID=UPI0039A4C399
MATLERELAAYKRALPELLADEGKYVLVKGDEIVDRFTSYEDALKIGYGKFGLEPFLVKLIERNERVANFTRRFVACPA